MFVKSEFFFFKSIDFNLLILPSFLESKGLKEYFLLKLVNILNNPVIPFKHKKCKYLKANKNWKKK